MPRSISQLRDFKSQYAEGGAMKIELSPELTLREAAPLWLASRNKISEGTILDYGKCIKRLTELMGDMKLSEITVGEIAKYQRIRLQGGKPYKKKAGASRINHETMTLGQILKRARLWQPIAEFFEPLPLPKHKRGRALSPEEEKKLFEIAASKPKCRVAFLVWTITVSTSAGWSEIANLRLKHVDLTKDTIHIQDGIKNVYRERILPLMGSARFAVERLVERAKRLGASSPEHFLIPDRWGNPEKPMGSCKTAWYSIRKKLVEEFPNLAGLRQYDLRHHCLTKLLENPDVSESTAEAIAGHISHDMKRRYSHIRRDAMRTALAALDHTHAQPAPTTQEVDTHAA